MECARVLVVEDFADLRKLVAFYLVTRGYRVFEAASGRVAIQTAINENPNFILLDLRLPDLNGLEVARELRKSPQMEHIPIVGWSADCPTNGHREALRHAGINDYLQKPVKLRDLDAVIERCLPKANHQQ
jgi:DNA-binding response OmpR family regulator